MNDPQPFAQGPPAQPAPLNQVASHAPGDGVVVSNSPIGLHDTIVDTPNGGLVTANDIKSVWQGDREAGWLYKGSDGHSYYQANLETVPQTSVSLDLHNLPVVGQYLEKVHGSAAGGANSPTLAPIEKLDPSKSIESQLPPHATVLDGFAHPGDHVVPHDGRQGSRSPEQVGDQIPNGTPHGTTVENINLIEDGDHVKGYVYRATDGHDYFQRASAGGWSATGSAGIGPVAGSETEPALSGVHRFQTGDIHPGERLVPANRSTPRLDDRLGLDPSRELTLRPGQSTTGSVVAVSEDGNVIQNAGRGAFYVHDKSLFEETPHVGDSLAVTMHQSGQTIAQVNPPAPERDLGWSRPL